MLKCSACNRAGGPFRLRHQIQADGQVIRSWSCPCGETFHASAGAERSAGAQIYSGFLVEHQGRNLAVTLKRMGKHETTWTLSGTWLITVSGPTDGPGTRTVAISGFDEQVLGEWRLQPGWGPAEVARRIRAWPLPPELSPDLLSRILVRMMA